MRQTCRTVSVRNKTGLLINYVYGQCNLSMAVGHPLSLSLHHRQLHLPSSQLKLTRGRLIGLIGHDLPTMFGDFSGLGLAPFNLCRTITFNKLYVADLDVTRLLCGMKNAILQRTYFLPLSHLIAKAKIRCYNPPPPDYAHMALFLPPPPQSKPVP